MRSPGGCEELTQSQSRRSGAAISAAKAMIDDRSMAWAKLLQDLIRIPSYFEAEHDIIRYVCEFAIGMGFRPILVPMEDRVLRQSTDAIEPISKVAGRSNVVVRVPGMGGGRSLVLNCHIDTQPVSDEEKWTRPPLSGHIDPTTNTIYGRGAMDDKAGVAICLGLMQVIVEQGLRFAGDVVFHFVLEDEITGNGSLACLEAGHAADAAIIVDGTRPDRAIDQHAGNMEFQIALKGEPASVSVSHLGVNAAERLSRVLLHLRESFHRLNTQREPPWTEFPSPYQFVIHGIWADASRFSIPIMATARCFVTFPPPATIEGMRLFLEGETRHHAEANSYSHNAEFNWNGFWAKPVCCATDELRALVCETARHNGISGIRIIPSTGTSDMRHFAQRGIPCLLYGPGRGFNPHRADEHFLLDDLPFMMKVYLDIVSWWCNSASSG
jgi:acetylornithine deacetylase